MRPDILATITLYEKGRRGPTPATELHCMMIINEHTFDVRLYFDRTGALSPGQTAEVPVRFLCPEDAARYVAVGETFVLRELHPIGEGVVKEVLMKS
jgi:hypothetical protein